MDCLSVVNQINHKVHQGPLNVVGFGLYAYTVQTLCNRSDPDQADIPIFIAVMWPI